MRLSPRRTSHALFLLGGLLLLGGCGGWGKPEPKPLPVTMPEAFSRRGEALPAARWWEAFESSELNVLVEKALSGNPGIRQALARIRQADAAARRAGASRFPVVNADAGASVTTTHGPASPLQPDRIVTREQRSHSGALAAVYELDLWGRIRAGREAALHAAEASREDLDAARIALASRVTDTWFGILEQRAQLALIREQTETLGTYLKLVETRFSHGLAEASDVYGQRQQIEATRASEPLARARLKELEHQLATLLGLAPTTPVAFPAKSFPPLPPLPRTGMTADLLRNRPDIRAATLRLAALDREVAAAVANRFPSLTLNARFSDSNERADLLFRNWVSTLAAGLAAPILDGGSRKAEVQRQQARVEEQLYKTADTVLTALREVEDALTRDAEQAEHLVRLNRQLTAARQSLDAARKSYVDGVGDYLRVLSALRVVLQIEQSILAQTRLQFTYRVRLCTALAGSWNAPRRPVADILVTEIPADEATQ